MEHELQMLSTDVQAAARAAAKTADFVNKGEWEEEEELSYHSSQDTGSVSNISRPRNAHNAALAREVHLDQPILSMPPPLDVLGR